MKHLIILCLLFTMSSNGICQKAKVEINDSTKTSEGYIFIVNDSRSQIIDRNGNVLYIHPGTQCMINEYKKEIYSYIDGHIVKLNHNIDIIWKKKYFVHHDMKFLNNGNIYFLSTDYDTISNLCIHFNSLIGLDSMGNEILKWSSRMDFDTLMKYMIESHEILRFKKKLDHYKPEDIIGSLNLNSVPDYFPVDFKELYHMNSIHFITENKLENESIIFERGNIILSFCNYNDSINSFIAILRPSDFKILWHYTIKNGYAVHTPSILKNGDILMYINSKCQNDLCDSSKIIKINPKTKEIVWEFSEPFQNLQNRNLRGSCQNLENGNILISNNSGYIYELTPEKKIVWSYHTDDYKYVYKAMLYYDNQVNWILNNN